MCGTFPRVTFASSRVRGTINNQSIIQLLHNILYAMFTVHRQLSQVFTIVWQKTCGSHSVAPVNGLGGRLHLSTSAWMSVGQSQAWCVQAVSGQTLHFEHLFSLVLTCFNSQMDQSQQVLRFYLSVERPQVLLLEPAVQEMWPASSPVHGLDPQWVIHEWVLVYSWVEATSA